MCNTVTIIRKKLNVLKSIVCIWITDQQLTNLYSLLHIHNSCAHFAMHFYIPSCGARALVEIDPHNLSIQAANVCTLLSIFSWFSCSGEYFVVSKILSMYIIKCIFLFWNEGCIWADKTFLCEDVFAFCFTDYCKVWFL